MSHRPLEIPGHFAAPPDLEVTFEGRSYRARLGEPLAFTLLAHGVYILGRSGKYHRPRGIFCGRGSCGNCLARVDGAPNQRLCLTAATPGAAIVTQNVLGTASTDLLQSIDWMFPEGLDHHHLMVESELVNRAAVMAARQLAGLGTLPTCAKPMPRLEHGRHDVVVVGGGAAGRAAASALRRAGRDVLTLDALAVSANVRRAQVLGYYDDAELVAVADDAVLRLVADVLVIATGAHEQPPACPGNDLPGVVSLRAAERAVAAGILPGQRIVLAMDPDADATVGTRAARLGEILVAAGARLVATLGPVSVAGAHSRLDALARISGHRRVRGVVSRDGERVSCDALVYAGRAAPAYELPRQLGIATRFDPRVGFVPLSDADGATTRAGVYLAGEVAGVTSALAAAHGQRVGEHIAASRSLT